MSNDKDPMTARYPNHGKPTQPSREAVRDVFPTFDAPARTMSDLDERQAQRMIALGTMLRGDSEALEGRINKRFEGIEKQVEGHHADIATLKRVARPKLESLSDIEDSEVVSGSVLRQAMRRQSEHAQLATDAQTLKLQAEAKAMLWKPVLATFSAIVLGLAAQYFAASGTIKSEVKASTKEAVREEATTVAKEAAEAVKESVQTAPKGTP